MKSDIPFVESQIDQAICLCRDRGLNGWEDSKEVHEWLIALVDMYPAVHSVFLYYSLGRLTMMRAECERKEIESQDV